MNMDSTRRRRRTSPNKIRNNCPIPQSSFTTFMDEGNMHFRAGKFRKALFCYDRALELKPLNQSALVARSQCHLKLGNAQAAFQDADSSVTNVDPKSPQFVHGLLRFAEALFNLGQFEKALIAYHRGYRMRKDIEEFRIGINKAKTAIRRAIADSQATQIEDLNWVLPRIESMNEEIYGKTQHCCVLDDPDDVARRRKGSVAKGSSVMREKWVDREVLGVLHKDKDYLKKFLKRPDIQKNQQSGSEILRDRATEALNYLNIREQFWRFQAPMYSRKPGLNFNNDMVMQYEKQEHERMEASRRIKMDAAKGAVVKHMGQIEHALKIGRHNDAKLECERALRQIKEVSPTILPMKVEYTTEILHYKGIAQMRMKQFDAAVATFQEEMNTAQQHKMTEVKSRAMDYLGKSYAMKGSYIDAAEIWDSRTVVAKSPIERAYLFHEIGRCYYELHKYDVARMYANQSLDEAKKINDDIWAMNALILLGQVECQQKTYQNATSFFEAAQEFANKCGHKANVKLLREAEQCIRLYMERETNAATTSKDLLDVDSDEDQSSED